MTINLKHAREDLARRLAAPTPLFSVRPETADDLDFSATVYAEGRQEELSVVPWDSSLKDKFLKSQFAAQHTHYEMFYHGAQYFVIVREALRLGRLYVHQASREVRVMDIALLAYHQRQGIGTELFNRIEAHADALGLAVTLHVEPQSHARLWYERRGYVKLEDRGIYWFMERPKPTHPSEPVN